MTLIGLSERGKYYLNVDLKQVFIFKPYFCLVRRHNHSYNIYVDVLEFQSWRPHKKYIANLLIDLFPLTIIQ